MAGIILSVLSTLVVLCVHLLPAVWGLKYSCSSYWDNDNFYHDTRQCGSEYCCGDCNKRYCCSEKKYRLTKEQQDLCPARTSGNKISNTAIILGAVFGSLVMLIPCVALIICCVTPCCLIHRKRQERRNQTPITTIISMPQQPHTPSGYQPSHPGYQPQPVQPEFGDPPMPSAPPPSYQEATDPANFPGPFTQGHPTYPFQPPDYPHEFSQESYNPSYNPHS